MDLAVGQQDQHFISFHGDLLSGSFLCSTSFQPFHGVADGGFEKSYICYTTPQAKKQEGNVSNMREKHRKSLSISSSVRVSVRGSLIFRCSVNSLLSSKPLLREKNVRPGFQEKSGRHIGLKRPYVLGHFEVKQEIWGCLATF